MEKKYTRHCPQCEKLLEYSSPQSFSVAKKRNRICGSCAQTARCQLPEEIERRSRYFSEKYVGEGNPFYGKTHSNETKMRLVEEGRRTQKLKTEHKSLYEYWVDRYGEAEALIRHTAWREKQKKRTTGSRNPMYGKPTPQGSGNGWSGWYDGWFFRSLLELSFMINVIKVNGHKWRLAETADLRIEYTTYDGRHRTYCADFLLDEKILVECKPKRLHNTPLVLAKKEAALEFCQRLGYTYLLTDCTLLKDEEIALMRNTGELRFTERYERKFMERTENG